MKRIVRKKSALLILSLVTLLLLAYQVTAHSEDLKDYTISGPHTHENLSIFVVQGKSEDPMGKKMITLDEGLKAKTVLVHETGNVNSLSIENSSPDTYVFIQSGDIVKGGKQDRTIQNDMVIKPKSGKVPLDAFCVEAGRWSKRGGESANSFSSSNDRLYSKKLKLAAKSKKSQAEVWKEVADAQDELSRKVGRNVKSGSSESSLQLTLENKDVQNEIRTYMDTLEPVMKQYRHAVGYAFTVNGEFNSCDIYGSSELFTKLWPKLLKASATEAVAAREKGKAYPMATVGIVESNLADAMSGKVTESKTEEGIHRAVQESDANVLYDTCDAEQKGSVRIHGNIIKK